MPKLTKKQKKNVTFFTLAFFVMGFLFILLIRYFLMNNSTTSNLELLNLSLFLVALSFCIFIMCAYKYGIIFRPISFLGIGMLLLVVFPSGYDVYTDFIKYNLIEKKLGINNLKFMENTNNKEVLNFLNTVTPEYTNGLNDILFISHPIFSFSVSHNGDELYSGEASGQYINETQDLIIAINNDFRDTFYHEIGHYIYMYKFTEEDRKEWEDLINISIDYTQIDRVTNEYALDSEEISSLLLQLEISREHKINEAFAVYFSASILNESDIQNEAIKDYFNQLKKEAENAE